MPAGWTGPSCGSGRAAAAGPRDGRRPGWAGGRQCPGTGPPSSPAAGAGALPQCRPVHPHPDLSTPVLRGPTGVSVEGAPGGGAQGCSPQGRGLWAWLTGETSGPSTPPTPRLSWGPGGVVRLWAACLYCASGAAGVGVEVPVSLSCPSSSVPWGGDLASGPSTSGLRSLGKGGFQMVK